VAIYHLSVKPITRASGRSATAAAAYRSAERITDHTSGEVFDYTRKRGVDHREIVLPTAAAKRDINWARDREQLWNAAERAENRTNSRVAREYEIALPHELNKAARLELVRTFAHELADRYGVGVDFSIHKPHRAGDERNHHAHVLTTTRMVEAIGLGGKSEIEWSDANRRKAGLKPAKEEISALRERWAQLTNEALEAAHTKARVDHRSLEVQGIDREPTKHLGPAVAGILERGGRSWLVARWQEEANRRLQLAKELGELEREQQHVSTRVLDLSNDVAASLRARQLERSRDLSPAQRREQARAQWLQLRQGRDKTADNAAHREHAKDNTPDRRDSSEPRDSSRKKDRGKDDDDFSL
jgi:ATP-dependent exoDNAse (exonuclease V) alpha subunit